MDLKDFVGEGKMVTFVRLYDGEAYYKCDNGFEFPIPAEDLKGAEFKASDKAIFFMRWVRKHLARDEGKRQLELLGLTNE